jgi:hypothetical protein
VLFILQNLGFPFILLLRHAETYSATKNLGSLGSAKSHADLVHVYGLSHSNLPTFFKVSCWDILSLYKVYPAS